MACRQALLVGTPRDLNYRTTTAVPSDPNKKKFRVVLRDVDDIRDNTTENDVTISVPPENQDGYFIVSFNDVIRCQRGPGFPNCDKDKAPVVEVDKEKQKITITLYKAAPGQWLAKWNELADAR